MLEKRQQPYEFLARWRDGVLIGAHVGFITQVLEDGKIISETVGDVMPVDVGGGQGFPLADILEQLHIGAIAAMDAAVTEKAETEGRLAQSEEKVKRLEQAESARIAAAPDAIAQPNK